MYLLLFAKNSFKITKCYFFWINIIIIVIFFQPVQLSFHMQVVKLFFDHPNLNFSSTRQEFTEASLTLIYLTLYIDTRFFQVNKSKRN